MKFVVEKLVVQKAIFLLKFAKFLNFNIKLQKYTKILAKK